MPLPGRNTSGVSRVGGAGPNFSDFATKAGVQQEAYTYSADVGTANAYVVALSPAPTIIAGSQLTFKAAHASRPAVS